MQFLGFNILGKSMLFLKFLLILLQASKLIFWITNPFGLVGINFTNQIIKFTIQESVLEIAIF